MADVRPRLNGHGLGFLQDQIIDHARRLWPLRVIRLETVWGDEGTSKESLSVMIMDATDPPGQCLQGVIVPIVDSNPNRSKALEEGLHMMLEQLQGQAASQQAPRQL